MTHKKEPHYEKVNFCHFKKDVVCKHCTSFKMHHSQSIQFIYELSCKTAAFTSVFLIQENKSNYLCGLGNVVNILEVSHILCLIIIYIYDKMEQAKITFCATF